jgi:hypothetical protein
VPHCEGRDCGTDGCGGSCGSCGSGESCVGQTCLAACTLGSCPSGEHCLDGRCCAADSHEPSGNSCGAAVNLGTLDDDTGDVTTVSGNIAPQGDVDWYRVTASDDGDTSGDEFDLEVVFTLNPGGLVFDVYKGGCTSPWCTGIGDCFNYYTDTRTGTGPTRLGENPCSTIKRPDRNLCGDDSSVFYIAVYRASGVASCSNYALRISNGRPSGISTCTHL